MESTNYFRRLTLGGVAARIFEVFAKGDNPAVFLSLSAIALVPFVVIMATTFFVCAALVAFAPAPLAGSSFGGEFHYLVISLVVFGFETIPYFYYVSMTVIGRGGMIRAVAETYLGSQPEWSACFHCGERRFWALFCSSCIIFPAALVGALVPGLFFNLFVVFKSFVLVCLVLVFPAIVVENKSAVGGIKRSFELVSSRWCYVFCTSFLFALAEIVILTIRREVVFGLGLDPFSVLGTVVRFAPSIFFLPMFTILSTVLYFNLRIEIEGMNAEVLSRDLGTEPTEGAYKGAPLMIDDESAI